MRIFPITLSIDQSEIAGAGIKKFLFSLCRKSICLYFLIFVCLWGLIDREKAFMKEMDYLRVPLGNLLLFQEGKKKLEPQQFRDYIQYYWRLSEFRPTQVEAYGMLGFCYYHLGDYSNAITFYNKAKSMVNQVYIFPYNLGVIYLKTGRYDKAVEFFESALEKDINTSINYINTSVFFGVERLGNILNIETNVMRGVALSYQGAILGHYYKKNYKSILVLANKGLELNFPNKAFYYYYGGVAAYYLEKYESALYLLRQCSKLKPQYSSTYHYLSLISKEMGDERMARIFSQKRESLLEVREADALIENPLDVRIF